MSSSKLLNTWYYQLFEKAIDQEIVYKVYNILEYLSDQSTIQYFDSLSMVIVVGNEMMIYCCCRFPSFQVITVYPLLKPSGFN